jgi:hypothetical protein
MLRDLFFVAVGFVAGGFFTVAAQAVAKWFKAEFEKHIHSAPPAPPTPPVA